MSKFFSNLPNVYVGVEGADEIISYKKVKNIFRRVEVQEKLQKYSNQFESYFIREGERPDMLANEMFGDPELDWVILLANNIVDPYQDWPIDANTLREMALEKYTNIDAVHHWETKPIKNGTIEVVKGGVEVNETYRAVLTGNTLTKDQSIYSVSNIEHEIYVNEKKRLIAMPSIEMVAFFEDQFSDLVDYVPNKEVDRKGDKKTNNSFASRFLDRADYRRSAPTTVSRTGEATGANVTYDNGPSSTTATQGVVSKT
tara:strand:- start:565 stop:1335 length:771 start_codon:yes stop_codon:yes gene_type:complete